MHKKWLRTFLLCVVCAVCLHGNCSAERWVRFEDVPSVGGPSPRFVNIDSVQSMEYNGRKFLKATTKVVFVVNSNSIVAMANTIFDLENNRGLIIEAVNGGIRTQTDISLIISADTVDLDGKTYVRNPADGLYVSLQPDSNLLQVIKQYRPDVVNEILAYNSGDTRNVTPSAGTQAVTANGDYGFIQTLGNGPVQFVPRMIHDGGTRYYVAGVPANGFLSIQDKICPPTAPDSHKPLYIVYDIDTYPSFSQNTIHAIFSYDDETNTFTLYDKYYDFSRPLRKIRIIDQNTVEGSYWDGETYSENNPLTIQFKYVKTLPDHSPDRDGYTWTGWDLENDEPAPIDVYFDLDKYVDPFYMNLSYELVYAKDNNEVGLDGLFAFLARKGNVGYAPPAGSRVKYY